MNNEEEIARLERLFKLHPLGPPSQRGSGTSKEAAESMADSAPRITARVYLWLEARGSYGGTVDEAEQELDLAHQTASPRMRELVLRGMANDTPKRRLTRYNRMSTVRVAVPCMDPNVEPWSRFRVPPDVLRAGVYQIRLLLLGTSMKDLLSNEAIAVLHWLHRKAGGSEATVHDFNTGYTADGDEDEDEDDAADRDE